MDEASVMLLLLLGKSSIAKEAWHAGSIIVQSTDEFDDSLHVCSDSEGAWHLRQIVTGRLRHMAAAMQQCTRAPILQRES
jgi:hypothetical protein